jgi:hypothetical protein
MDTFAETAIFDYRLSIADQGKQTSFFHFRLKQTKGNLPFPFSVAVNKWRLLLSVSTFFCLWNSGNLAT